MAMEITLTDGGIETRIIYEFRRSIGDFEAYKLLRDEPGRAILRRIYESYAEVAVRYRLPIQFGTPTWRASRKWTSNVRGRERRCGGIAGEHSTADRQYADHSRRGYPAGFGWLCS